MAEEYQERRGSQLLDILRRYGFLFVFAGGLIFVIASVQYVIEKVNPDAVTEIQLYKQKLEFRWCLQTSEYPLKCGD